MHPYNSSYSVVFLVTLQHIIQLFHTICNAFCIALCNLYSVQFLYVFLQYILYYRRYIVWHLKSNRTVKKAKTRPFVSQLNSSTESMKLLPERMLPFPASSSKQLSMLWTIWNSNKNWPTAFPCSRPYFILYKRINYFKNSSPLRHHYTVHGIIVPHNIYALLPLLHLRISHLTRYAHIQCDYPKKVPSKS